METNSEFLHEGHLRTQRAFNDAKNTDGGKAPGENKPGRLARIKEIIEEHEWGNFNNWLCYQTIFPYLRSIRVIVKSQGNGRAYFIADLVANAVQCGYIVSEEALSEALHQLAEEATAEGEDYEESLELLSFNTTLL